jgi:catechol 2,3-dioxygenase-like lactoylglutathione lyase family enzyme
MPILRVRDLEVSLDYYVRVLGFEVDWKDAGVLASVSREKTRLFVCEGDQSAPHAWVWIGAKDIVPLHAELVKRGAIIRQPPTNHWWALEMQVADPDGNVLRIGSEPIKGDAEGEWLDADGERWRKNKHGEWTRDAK